jgi:hypothetical protein
MGPSYACLFVGYIESQIFSQYTGPCPSLFKRFIDDCVGLWTRPLGELQTFINFVGNFHPSLKFTHEISDSSLTFLDIQLQIQPGSTLISTSVFYKETDSHSYLLHSSSHPNPTKDSIPYSQFLRLRRLCSNEDDFMAQAHRMVTFFTARGYPETLVRGALDRAASTSRSHALTPRDPLEQEDRTLFTLTYHPHNLPVKQVLIHNFKILQEDPQLQTLFKKPPLAAFKRDRNLGDMLVRSTFKTNTVDLPPGNTRCNQPRCKCCTVINTSATSFTGPSGRSFIIKRPFNCQTTNVVYIIHCSLCSQLYVGETYRTLSERCKEHMYSIHQHKNTPVAQHFTTPPHTISHFSIAAVWRNSTSDPLHRKYTETKTISLLDTKAPRGMNLRD